MQLIVPDNTILSMITSDLQISHKKTFFRCFLRVLSLNDGRKKIIEEVMTGCHTLLQSALFLCNWRVTVVMNPFKDSS